MLIVLLVVLVGFLITNPAEHVTVTIGSTQYPDVPLALVALIALALGVALTSVVALTEGAAIRLANRRLRREIQRLETENSFLRSQSDLPASEPNDYEPSPSSELPELTDSPPRKRPASAPVYDPTIRDPRAD